MLTEERSCCEIGACVFEHHRNKQTKRHCRCFRPEVGITRPQQTMMPLADAMHKNSRVDLKGREDLFIGVYLICRINECLFRKGATALLRNE